MAPNTTKVSRGSLALVGLFIANVHPRSAPLARASTSRMVVSSWYDSGVRLTEEEPPTPPTPPPEKIFPVYSNTLSDAVAPARPTVTSWYDAGIRLKNPWYSAKGDRGSWYDAGIRL